MTGLDRSRLRRLPFVVRRSLVVVRDGAGPQIRSIAVLQVFGAALLGAQLAVLAAVVSELTDDPEPSLSATAPELAAFVLLSLVTAAAAFAAAERRNLAAERTSVHVQDRVLRAAARAPYAEFEDPAFLDVLQRLVHDAEHRPYALVAGLVSLGASLLTLATLAMAIALTAPVLLLVVLAGAVPLATVVAGSGRATYRAEVDLAAVDRERLALTQIVIGRLEAPELHASGSAGHLVDRIVRLGRRRLDVLSRLAQARERRHVAAGVALALALGAALGCLVWLVDRGEVGLGAAGALAFGLQQFGGHLRGAVVGVGALHESALFADELLAFLAAHPDGAATPAPDPAAVPPLTHLRLDGVTFRYPGAARPVIDRVTFDLVPGRVVALVGENGAGKSTLVKVLCGLLEPEAGTVWWNDARARDLPPDALRRRMAVLFQSFVRYELAAADNIGLGDPARVEDRPAIEDAARWAGIHPVLAGLRDGYDTVLSPAYDGGTDLSGGQWQQVALARAAFRDADLLVLDEPTAALDPAREREVFDWLRREAGGRAVLVVSHRMSTVRAADEVVVLSGGRVVEHGPPEVLLAAGGPFATLHGTER